MKNIDTTLYFITDSTGFSEEEFLRRTEEALKGGVSFLQLREKDKTTREYISLAEKVHTLTKKYNVPLIIDDRVDVALVMGAEGVHLGQSDMPISTARKILGDDFIIGATTKTVPQALEAYKQGADYLGVGAIYPTTTKVKTVLTSTETVDAICKAVPIPVNAIGGLNKNNVQVLEGIDIAGFCVVSAIMKADDPKVETEILLKLAKKLTKHKRNMKTALTIAGSDSSGGAGIQADIKTMTMNGVYAMSAITALTAQNTTGVRAIQEMAPDFLKQQIDAVFEDIFPESVKIGMISSGELVCVIADRLKYHKAKNIVVDPVMLATSGSSLMKTDAVKTLIEELLPITTLVTPNIPEAEILSGFSIENKDDSDDILVYTGFKIEELTEKQLENISVLIDGKYVEELNDNSLLRGSSNQRIHILEESQKNKYEIYLNTETNKIQNFTTNDGIVSVGIHKKKINPTLKASAMWHLPKLKPSQ